MVEFRQVWVCIAPKLYSCALTLALSLRVDARGVYILYNIFTCITYSWTIFPWKQFYLSLWDYISTIFLELLFMAFFEFSTTFLWNFNSQFLIHPLVSFSNALNPNWGWQLFFHIFFHVCWLDLERLDAKSSRLDLIPWRHPDLLKTTPFHQFVSTPKVQSGDNISFIYEYIIDTKFLIKP